MNIQRFHTLINSLAILAVIFLRKNDFVSLLCLVGIMLLNFWQMCREKRK